MQKQKPPFKLWRLLHRVKVAERNNDNFFEVLHLRQLISKTVKQLAGVSRAQDHTRRYA